ncbi:MAG TPA: polysaccharide biosynthesis tyrosine autokinase [Candidatus Acidoferrales bacterium]
MRDRKGAEPFSVITAAPVASWEQMPKEPHLLDYLIILKKHQWLVLSFLLTVVTVVTIVTFRMRPVYIAAARVEVDRETQSIQPFPEANSYDDYVDSENYIETQTKILQSETLALQTIKSMDLGRYPEFGGSTNTFVIAHAGVTSQRPPILGAFLGGLSVQHIKDSRLIEVRFEAQDPQLAAQIVNGHVRNYIEANFRSKYDATTQASTWLSGELEELRLKVEKSEAAKIAYERENQIWTIDEKQNITTQKLADLNKNLTEAETELVQKQALYQIAKSGDIDQLPDVRNNAYTSDLLRRLSDLNEQYVDASAQFGPNYPKVQRIAREKKELADALGRAKQDILTSIETDYKTAQQRVELFSAALEKQKSETNDMSEKLVEYHILEHDADSNKQLYDGLQQKLREAGITAGLRTSNIRIVDPALVPTSPARPQRAKNILLGFLVGLVGGVGLAFLREYLDNTVKSPDDVERLAGLPSLAVVPSLPNILGSIHSSKLLTAGEEDDQQVKDSRVEIIAFAKPKSQVSEAFRALRTSLLLSQAEHPPQVILVTSALPREGKTTSALNLAVTLAQLGDRTLIVDCDLRKPGIRRALGLTIGREFGLSSYLAGVASLDDVVIPHPQIENLAALTTGPIPPSPADLLSSHRMRDAITYLRQKYKFVVIDSPPIMAATDAVILSALTDGVLLVVRSGETPKEAFTRTCDLLQAVKSRLLGVVLNAVDSSAPDYYYSYRYYPYAYGYGYGEDAPGKRSKFPGSGSAPTS